MPQALFIRDTATRRLSGRLIENCRLIHTDTFNRINGTDVDFPPVQ
jgi:hypothetical protein